jgi:hypothetical protein
MPRFVILRHELPPASGRATHWDFMLEAGDTLRTWALDAEPAAGSTIAGTALADHRLAYLDHEGPVSGDRGHVTRFAAGDYKVLDDTADGLVLRLRSPRLAGELRIASVDPANQRFSFSFAGNSSATAGGT